MLIPSEKDGESRNGTVLQNLTTLFGLAKLTPPMRTLLHRAMFTGESGISRELFLNAWRPAAGRQGISTRWWICAT